MGGIGKAISNFADDALGFDPNGGGFVPYYDLAGTALGVGPVGTIGATGVNAINQITGQGGQQGALGQILGAVGAGVGQAQKNSQQDKLADRMLGYVDKAIGTQQGMYDKSLGLQNKANSDIFKNLQPYRQSGQRGLTSLTDLTLNPQSQANFLQNSPFYNSMVNDAQSRLMKNQATRGKLGSGDTAKALQDEVLKIGSDLMQRELGNRQGLANTGLTATNNQNTLQQAGANNITNLNTGMGNTLSNLFKEQSDIVGNKMANQNSPFQAGISQFLQPTQGQSGGGLGGLLGGLGGLFGGGSSTPVSTGGGSFGNFGLGGFGF